MSVPQVQVWTPGEVYPNNTFELWMHLQRRDPVFNLVDIKQADLSSITYGVKQGQAVIIASGTALTISSAIFDTLQNGTAWTGDTVGLNFAFTVPAAAVPQPNAEYLLTFTFTLTGGTVFPIVVKVQTESKPS